MFRLLSLLVVVFASVRAEELKAVAILTHPVGNNISGKISFTQTTNGVQIEGTLTNLKPGKHGFHIHSFGDLSNGCTSTGSHFNPYNKTHGSPNAKVRHVGDLGNIIAEKNGSAKISILDKGISLTGETCIIGRAVIVHADEDDLGLGGDEESLKTGNAGARIGCGIVGRLDEGTGGGSALTLNIILGLVSLLTIKIAS